MESIKSMEINDDIISPVFGTYDENIKLIEERLKVNIRIVGSSLVIRGARENINAAEKLILKLIELARKGGSITKTKVRHSLDLVETGDEKEIIKLEEDVVAVTSRGKQIKCKTLGQRNYAKSILNNSLVFGVGPAGTGKTYLATAMAVSAYRRSEVEKIILTRPAIEAGEKLGFLPGDLQEKVDPYLRPLYDALEELFGIDNYEKLLERGIIEVAPLAYMRGRTLNNAFIILDEAQNTTAEQMKMFLTRMGENSKIVVNGDDTQIDLPDKRTSGLIHAVNILKDIEGICICYLSDKDIVRHELVQKIVQAYSKETHNKGGAR